MTLNMLIKQQTGWGISEFCKRKHYNLHSVRRYSLPVGSKNKRNPPESKIKRLAKDLDVSKEVIKKLCERESK